MYPQKEASSYSAISQMHQRSRWHVEITTCWLPGKLGANCSAMVPHKKIFYKPRERHTPHLTEC